MNNILNGTMYITDNPEVIYNIPLNQPNIKIVNLDEDGVLMNNDAMLVGTCLLPPVQAKIAEADGNEQLYDTIYINHLLEPYQYQFLSALLAYLYKGGNIVMFLPELGYTNTLNKLISILYDRYGFHIGFIGDPDPMKANWYYDDRCIPMWINMLYSVRIISGYEYLTMYPLDAAINNNKIMEDIIIDISPYGKTFNDKLQYINRLRVLLHQNPNIRPAIIDISRRVV